MEADSQTQDNRSWTRVRRKRQIAMFAILAVAALARLYNLRNSPGWYHDETIYVGEAWNLMHGKFQWDAVEHTFLPRLPLFHFIIGPVMLAMGKDLLWVRLVSAICGILTTWLIYRIVRELGSRRAALIASTLFAICPYTVLLNRWGFTYNLDSVLGVANLYFLLRHWRAPARGRYLWLAALTCGLGMVTDPMMASRFVLLAAVAFFSVSLFRAAAAVAGSLAPLAVYFAVMLIWHQKIFIEDIGVILGGRVNAEADWFSLAKALGDYLDLLGPFAMLGLVGLAFVGRSRGRILLLAAVALDFAANVKLAVDDAGLLYRMGIIIVPAFFIGLGFLFDDVWPRIEAIIREEFAGVSRGVARLRGRTVLESELSPMGLVGGFARVTAVAVLLTLFGFQTYQGVLGYFPDLPKHYRRASVDLIDELEGAALWLKPRLNPEDLVITTHMEWMLDCRVASPMLVQLYDGGETNSIYFDALLERFQYPCSLDDARYFVSHEAMPYLSEVYILEDTLREIFDTWDMAHSEGSVRVFANPNWKPAANEAESWTDGEHAAVVSRP